MRDGSRVCSRGFTLVEIIVVIALFTGLMALGLFMSMGTFTGTMYRSEQATIVSILQRARSRAMANIDESPHGVCYDSSAHTYNIICTAGTCSASTEDRIEAQQGVSVSGLPVCGAGAILFDQLTGDASGMSPITVAVAGHPTQTITINNEGAIIW
jgi:prepilin-type N-terminal cleavage/methylation domain-containing protein